MANQTGYNGQQDPGAGADDFAATANNVRAMLLQIQTTKLVQVKAVRNEGGLEAVGFLDIQPMVNQLDGAGNPTPHGIIYNVPYLRLQGGTDAIILDPKVDDIGIAGFCTHDISVVKSTRAAGNPGSRRRFDYADAIYIGGVLNGVPEQYIRFSAEGIEMVSPTKITGRAPVIEFIAEETISMTSSGDITMEAPDIGTSGDTFSIDASATATVTAPNISLIGNTTASGTMVVAGLTSLNGGFGALPRAGGGANTISSALAISQTLAVTGAGTFTSSLSAGGKDVGGTHRHSGVQTGGGTSGGPV